MTQFPTTFGEPSLPGQTLATRTSWWAITALTSGILSLACCCVPGVGVLCGPFGLLAGVLAMMGISRSQGGLAGNGLAISGMITGLLGTLAGAVVLVGILAGQQDFKNKANAVGAAITSAQGGDYAPLKSQVSPTRNPVAPEQAKDFTDQVTAKLGKFQSAYGGLVTAMRLAVEFEGNHPAVAQQLRSIGQPMILPAQFENGRAGIIIVMPSPVSLGSGTAPDRIYNLGVYQEGSTDIIWLVPFK